MLAIEKSLRTLSSREIRDAINGFSNEYYIAMVDQQYLTDLGLWNLSRFQTMSLILKFVALVASFSREMAGGHMLDGFDSWAIEDRIDALRRSLNAGTGDIQECLIAVFNRCGRETRYTVISLAKFIHVIMLKMDKRCPRSVFLIFKSIDSRVLLVVAATILATLENGQSYHFWHNSIHKSNYFDFDIKPIIDKETPNKGAFLEFVKCLVAHGILSKKKTPKSDDAVNCAQQNAIIPQPQNFAKRRTKKQAPLQPSQNANRRSLGARQERPAQPRRFRSPTENQDKQKQLVAKTKEKSAKTRNRWKKGFRRRKSS